jgi:homocysteine S-methyltransferase
LLATQGFVLLDGGLATELEARGHDLAHPLWSARLLLERQGEIETVHRAYLRAGADCVVTASYQASVPGLMDQGLSRAQAEAVLVASVDLAEAARDAELGEEPRAGGRPFVAASVGPYGAARADGSEYTGDYGVGRDALRDFHAARFELLAERCPLLAVETLPSLAEAEVLLALLDAAPGTRAWFSFSCDGPRTISDGTPIEECAALLAGHPRVLAVGVNCTAPRHVPELLRRLHEAAPDTPLVAYPNSGETYDAARRAWTGDRDAGEFAALAGEWYAAGARFVGGCCRTGPAHVRALRAALEGSFPD